MERLNDPSTLFYEDPSINCISDHVSITTRPGVRNLSREEVGKGGWGREGVETGKSVVFEKKISSHQDSNVTRKVVDPL